MTQTSQRRDSALGTSRSAHRSDSRPPILKSLTVIETLLRNRSEFYDEIRAGIDLDGKIRAMFISCAVFLGFYGLVMGAWHSIPQAASSAIKLPTLFLATLTICAPSLHFFNILFGSRQSAAQTLALILTGISTTAVLLFSLAPITLFFLVSGSEYGFYKILNFVCFVIAGVLGTAFLRRGMQIVTEPTEIGEGSEDTAQSVRTRRMIFVLWVLMYGFVGMQMAWTLSPFMGDPSSPFVLLRREGGNIYADVLMTLMSFLSPIIR